MEERLRNMWVVVWEVLGAVHLITVDELIRRNRRRFLEHKAGDPALASSDTTQDAPRGGYAVLGFADTFEKAQEGRREMMRLRRGATPDLAGLKIPGEKKDEQTKI
jgi:hypothetical protein